MSTFDAPEVGPDSDPVNHWTAAERCLIGAGSPGASETWATTMPQFRPTARCAAGGGQMASGRLGLGGKNGDCDPIVPVTNGTLIGPRLLLLASYTVVRLPSASVWVRT